MRKAYELLRRALAGRLQDYEAERGSLIGVARDEERDVFLEQLIDSVNRDLHFSQLLARPLTSAVADPRTADFDPVRASIYHQREGNMPEAYWMAFLFTHFGKSAKYGWSYTRAVYGRLDAEPEDWWTWRSLYADSTEFLYWLNGARTRIQSEPGAFGNHRKYVSLDAMTDRGTGAAFVTYVEFVEAHGGTQEAAFGPVEGESRESRFDRLYRAMSVIGSFGRTARFDHLTTLRRLGLADVRPPHTYMQGATGPLTGARLLFDGDPQSSMSRPEAQAKFVSLGEVLGLDPDIVEDAACNWQKSPSAYKRFTL